MAVGIADRLRHWYEHEKDSNRAMLQMLDSVPEARRSDPRYQQAIDIAMHLVTARRNWLNRIGGSGDVSADWFPKGNSMSDIRALYDGSERAWSRYLAELDESTAQTWFRYQSSGGARAWESKLETILVQVNGHAWYHRGQIALLVGQLEGSVEDTDFIYWSHRTANDPRSLD